MKRNYLLLLLFFCSFIKVYGQQFFSVNKDSTQFNLTIEGASFLSSLPLKCLQQELITWNDSDARVWQNILQPLCDTIISLWMNFLPKQSYANRTGVHQNTAFGLVFAFDYARTAKNKKFE